MTYRFILFSLPLVLFVFNGCGGPAKPSDFPKLVRPVTVKVLKDGAPLSDVTVSLHPKGSMMSFDISGRTGADGVATLQTSRNTYIRPGVPEGKFAVQLNETINVDMSDWKVPTMTRIVDGEEIRIPSDSPQVAEATSKEFTRRADALRRFSKALTSSASPLEMDISSAPVAIEFDVSKY